MSFKVYAYFRHVFPLLCTLLLTASSALAQDALLVKDGGATSAIFVEPDLFEPDKPVPQLGRTEQDRQELERRRLRDSVQDLSLYLQKMSGAKVEVVQSSPPPDEKRLPILIGKLAEKQFGPVKQSSPYKQGWRMVISDKGIGLLGESDEAASYAIFELLNRLGCRWYMPGEMGEYVPQKKSLALPATDVSEVPSTIRRDIWYADDAFKRRSRMGGLNLASSHALEDYIKRSDLEKHPDWNAEIDGKRSINGRLCWANPEVVDALSDGVIANLDRFHTPTISLSPNDGSVFCQCDKCKALDAGDWDTSMGEMSITDRYVHLCNQIAERVTKKYPNELFGFLAYVQYTRPPVREKVHPNLVPEIAPITYCRAHAMTDKNCPSRPQIRAIVEGWGKAAHEVAYYNYMFHLAEMSVPYPMIHQMSEELPIIYANKVRFWQPETTNVFESVLPGMVLSNRMAWDSKEKPAIILDEFYSNFYGAAAAPMRRYWQIFDDAWTNVPEHAGAGFGHARRFTPDILKAARTAMDEALAACQTPMERRRVEMHDESLRQFELFMKLRWDLFSGKLAVVRSSTTMERDVTRWMGNQLALAEKYESAYAFGKVGWTPYTICGEMFKDNYLETYNDRVRIAKNFKVISPALRNWQYQVDKEKRGEAAGWQKPELNDTTWKTTDPCVDTWFDLGLDAYFGPVWYRANINVPAVPAGKKVYLWASSVDGNCKAFVNGQAIPWVNDKGVQVAEAGGWCKPISWDITAAVKPGAYNQVTLVGTRTFANELGTGGLLGPALIYQDK